MKLPLWAKWIWWVVLIVVVSFVLWKRLDLTTAGMSTPFDSVAFIVWVALLLAPIFSEVKIWGVELKQEIKEVKDALGTQINALKTEISSSINVQNYVSSAVPTPPTDDELPSIKRGAERAFADKRSSVDVPPQVLKIDIPSHVEYLFSARYNIEREVRRITEELLDQRSRTQIRRQVDILAKTGWISREIAEAIIDVYSICSPAVHGDPVSEGQVALVRDIAPTILATLREIPALRPD